VHVADSKNSRGLALTTTLSTAVAAQGLVTQKNISLAMAPTIAQAAVAQCESMGFKVSGNGRRPCRPSDRDVAWGWC
jgi:hypothetical protein